MAARRAFESRSRVRKTLSGALFSSAAAIGSESGTVGGGFVEVDFAFTRKV